MRKKERGREGSWRGEGNRRGGSERREGDGKGKEGGGIEGNLYYRILRLPDLPSVDLLPPKVITDLRDVAAYYHDSPGENHSGNLSSCYVTPLIICLWLYYI